MRSRGRPHAEVQGGDCQSSPRTATAPTTADAGPRGSNPEWEAYYDDITEGWTTFVISCGFALTVIRAVPANAVLHGRAPVADPPGARKHSTCSAAVSLAEPGGHT